MVHIKKRKRLRQASEAAENLNSGTRLSQFCQNFNSLFIITWVIMSKLLKEEC